MIRISVVIISFNEEKFIERCIRSVKPVADDIVVLDSFSSDRTEEICKNLGVRFFQHKFDGYRDQKNYATSLANYDYILSLDADEALSEDLSQSIQEAKQQNDFDAYYCNRLNNYCGQWIYHSNWYPDRKLRLFYRRKGQWGGYNLHETVFMENGAKVSQLKGDLLHWVHSSYEEHIEKANVFSTLGAIEYYKDGRKANVFSPILHMSWRFIKSFLLRKGFMDGFNGFVICSISAYTSFLKYIKLRQLILKEKNGLKDNLQKQNEVKIAQ